MADSYTCDDFRMYEFKARRCVSGRIKDWTECPSLLTEILEGSGTLALHALTTGKELQQRNIAIIVLMLLA